MDTRPSQYETVTIDPGTGKHVSNAYTSGTPRHGSIRADGMIWSADYGEFVSKGVFDFEENLKIEWEQDQAKRDAEREQSWEDYWKKNSGPSLDEQLQEKARAVWEAEQGVRESTERIRLYDEVIPEIEDRVRALNSRTKLLSDAQISAMAQSMVKAIAKGATEDDLTEIAKNYIRMGMDATEAAGAGYEEEEAYIQLKDDVFQTILSINSIVNPVSGTILEAANGMYQGYAEDGIGSALWTAAKYTLPVNAAEALHNGGSFTEVLLALVQDAGNVAQLKGGLSGAGNSELTESLDDIGATPPKTRADRAADEWVEKCVSNPELFMEKTKLQTERSKAWIIGRQEGVKKVEAFEAAVRSGNTDDVCKAMMDVQRDKHALQAINTTGDDMKKVFNNTINNIYDITDKNVIHRLSTHDDYVASLRRKYGADIDIHVGKVAPTNPNATVKVSYDRDITYRTIIKDKAGNTLDVIDVPPKYSEQIYNEEFYHACGSPVVPGCDTAADAARKFGQDMDQAVTDRLHAEAYGSGPDDLHVALNNPAGNFTDPEQIGQAMGYKANHWYEKADNLMRNGDLIQAEAAIEEGMRQTTKQFDNQLIKRLEAANTSLAAAGKAPTRVPGELQDAIDVMKRVGTGPGKGFTPAQAEQILETMGWTPKQVGYEMGKFVESLQKLSPI
jgi:hypothetical protein